WAINNQLGRRNLTKMQSHRLSGLLYKEQNRGHGVRSGNQYTVKTGQNDPSSNGHETASKLAAQFGVSEKTIRRNAKLVDDLEAISEVDEELEAEILTSPSPPKRKDIRRAAEAVKQGESPRAVLDAAQKAKEERHA